MSRERTPRPAVLLALIVLTLLTSGCISLRDPESSFDYTGDVVAVVEKGAAVAQTFRVRRTGLNSLQLWLRKSSSEGDDRDVLRVSIYRSLDDPESLVEYPITLGQIKDHFPYEIQFAAQHDPPGQVYTLLLEAQRSPVAVYGRNEDAYPDGVLTIAGVEQAGDLGFRTSYEYGLESFAADLKFGLSRFWLVVPILLLFWVPGSLILEITATWLERKKQINSPDHERAEVPEPGLLLLEWDWGTRTAVAVGLSMCASTLLLLWTTALGLHLSAGWVWLYCGLAAAGWGYLRLGRGKGTTRPTRLDPIDWALLGIFLLVLAARLVTIRDLAVPAWVDSIHHALIIRLIAEQGAYPLSYEPFVQTSTASYHAGYHALVAFFHWVSGLEIDQAMLLLGQLLNAFAAIAVYLLGSTLSKDRRIGLFAAFISAFLTPMPNIYTTWGRYTQLAGLVILPVCAALLVALLEREVFSHPPVKPLAPQNEAGPPEIARPFRSRISRPNLALAVLAGFSGAGLVLVHYRVAAFLGLLMAAYFTSQLFRSLNRQPLWRVLPRALGWTSAVVGIGFLLALPWLPELWQSLLQPRLGNTAAAPQAIQIDWGYLKPGFGELSLRLAFLGTGLSLVRKRWYGPTMALWVGLLFLSANQGNLRIPGSGNINLSSVEIMLFMPIAVLGALTLETAAGIFSFCFPRKIKTVSYALLAGGLCALALLGLQRQISVIIPSTILFRSPDRLAIRWIEEHVPPDETILINPFLWGYGVYAGYDGGYWISPLSGRKTFPPNLLYALIRQPVSDRTSQLAQQVIDLASDPEKLHGWLVQQDIRYVYCGRRSGVLSPASLSKSPKFELLYNKDGTWLFEVK